MLWRGKHKNEIWQSLLRPTSLATRSSSTAMPMTLIARKTTSMGYEPWAYSTTQTMRTACFSPPSGISRPPTTSTDCRLGCYTLLSSVSWTTSKMEWTIFAAMHSQYPGHDPAMPINADQDDFAGRDSSADRSGTSTAPESPKTPFVSIG